MQTIQYMLFIAFLVCRIVLGQENSTNLPECITTCATANIGSCNSLLNVTCLCSSTVTDIACCAWASCPVNDLRTGMSFFLDLCQRKGSAIIQNPCSSSVPTDSAAPTASTTSITTNVTTAIPPASRSEDLSTGSKAAIGAVIPSVLLIAAAIVFFILRRRKRSRRIAPTELEASGHSERREMAVEKEPGMARHTAADVYELSDNDRWAHPQELRNNDWSQRHEMGNKSRSASAHSRNGPQGAENSR